MTAEEAIERLKQNKAAAEFYAGMSQNTNAIENELKDIEAMDMAIEALKAKCPTCKWCSDHQTSGTRCPIEEHYALPKDGYCHLYEPYKAESEESHE